MAMSISGTEWLIILAVIVLVFGRSQVWQLMGNAGRSLTNFRRGLTDPADPADPSDGAGPVPPAQGG
jgi:TatA/E family protein of Tat protein translocase